MRSSGHETGASLTHTILQQPLRTYVLPLLSPRSLAALRHVCQTTQHLVYDTTAELWSCHALRLGVPHQLLPDKSPSAPAVYAALRERAVLMSCILHWETSATVSYPGLLKAFACEIKPKLSWIWHSPTKARVPQCSLLQIYARNSANFPSYDSQSDSGMWEAAFMAQDDHSTSQLAVLDASSGQIGFIYGHDGFCDTCTHLYEHEGQTYLLCGAGKQADGCLTNRVNAYSPHELSTLGPDDEGYLTRRMWGEDGMQLVQPSAQPMPAWQQERSWQSDVEQASVSAHGSVIAWQTERSTFAVVHLITHDVVAELQCNEVADRDSNIVNLQWSSSGNHMAVQVATATKAQLILWDTGIWQKIAYYEYSSAFSLAWAPARALLAILHDMTVQVGSLTCSIKAQRLQASILLPSHCIVLQFVEPALHRVFILVHHSQAGHLIASDAMRF